MNLSILIDLFQVLHVAVGENFEPDSYPPPDPNRCDATTLATQITAVSELRVISQPTDVPDLADVPNYVFDQTAGTGVTIYSIEDGINTASVVSGI